MHKTMLPPELRKLPVVGRGVTSIVLEHPLRSTAVLVCTVDLLKRDWLLHSWGLCIGEQYMSPHRTRDYDVQIIEMPRMEKICGRTKEVSDMVRGLRAWKDTHSRYTCPPITVELQPISKQLNDLHEFLCYYNPEQYCLDLHRGNIMRYKNHYVLTDPIICADLLQKIKAR